MSDYQIIHLRKLANYDGQERVKKFDPDTGEPKLVNPATPGDDHEPWPLLGVTFIGEPPQLTTVGTSWVDQASQEGWLRRIGERAVARPGGPSQAPWAKTHTFIHADRLEITDQVRGEVVYRVTQQPDKYWTWGSDDQGVMRPVEEYGLASDEDLAKTEVCWFYVLEIMDDDAAEEAVLNG